MSHHVCYGGELSCSACNPCAVCHDLINQQIVAYAMQRTTAFVLQTRGDAGVVSIRELLDPNQFWAVFFGFYEEAWKNLHVAMMADPEVNRRAFDLRSIPAEVFTAHRARVDGVLLPAMAPPASAQASLPFAAPAAAAPPLPAFAGSFSFPIAAPPEAPPPAVVAPPPSPEIATASVAIAAAPADIAESTAEMNGLASLIASNGTILRDLTADDIAASATLLVEAPEEEHDPVLNGARAAVAVAPPSAPTLSTTDS